MKLVSILSFYLLSTFSTLYGKGDNLSSTYKCNFLGADNKQ